MWVQSLGQEDPLEEGMATHSSILAWRIPWIEEPGGLKSIEVSKSWTSQRVELSKSWTSQRVELSKSSSQDLSTLAQYTKHTLKFAELPNHSHYPLPSRYHYSHFTQEETEAQKNEITYPKPHK